MEIDDRPYGPSIGLTQRREERRDAKEEEGIVVTFNREATCASPDARSRASAFIRAYLCESVAGLGFGLLATDGHGFSRM